MADEKNAVSMMDNMRNALAVMEESSEQDSASDAATFASLPGSEEAPVEEVAESLYIRPNADTRDGVSTFAPDLKKNRLHQITNDVASKTIVGSGKRKGETGAFVDLSGANRSDAAIELGLSEENHFDQNALDISIHRNPTFFEKTGKLTKAGENLVAQYIEEGFKVYSGDGHLHVDQTTDGPDILREKNAAGLTVGNDKLFASIEAIYDNIKKGTGNQALGMGELREADEALSDDPGDEFTLGAGIADQLKALIKKDGKAGKIPEVDFNS